MTAVPAIDLESVSMSYRVGGSTVEVLRDITLSVAPGSTLAVTGPSGCGKSTLLAVVGGLERPTGGRVCVGGREIGSMRGSGRAELRRRELGFVFQVDNLLPFLTALENVALGLALVDRHADPDRCRDLLVQLGLGSQLDRLPDQLSGGQRQRVAVARALVKRPVVVLADEPTGALDSGSSRGVMDLMLATCAEAGAALVVVTHDLEVADRMQNTVALHGGSVVPRWSSARAG